MRRGAAHIRGGGYSAGYYAYVWSEVVDDDAYAWFTEHGGLTWANGRRFRDMLLSRGGTEDAAAMVARSAAAIRASSRFWSSAGARRRPRRQRRRSGSPDVGENPGGPAT